MAFELLPLPYPNSALEPRMSLRSPSFYREHVIDLKLGPAPSSPRSRRRVGSWNLQVGRE